jgi:hypothetical protein
MCPASFAFQVHSSSKPPDEVTAFVARVGTTPSPTLVSSALRALERIRTKSESGSPNLNRIYDVMDEYAKRDVGERQ